MLTYWEMSEAAVSSEHPRRVKTTKWFTVKITFKLQFIFKAMGQMIVWSFGSLENKSIHYQVISNFEPCNTWRPKKHLLVIFEAYPEPLWVFPKIVILRICVCKMSFQMTSQYFDPSNFFNQPTVPVFSSQEADWNLRTFYALKFGVFFRTTKWGTNKKGTEIMLQNLEIAQKIGY